MIFQYNISYLTKIFSILENSLGYIKNTTKSDKLMYKIILFTAQ